MSFVIQQNPTYRWPLTLSLPVDDGKREKSTFTAVFRRLKQSRIEEISRLARSAQYGRDEEGELPSDRDVVREVLADWDDVVDDEREPVPFTDSTLSQMLEIPTVSGQIIAQWFESLEPAKKKPTVNR